VLMTTSEATMTQVQAGALEIDDDPSVIVLKEHIV